MANSQEEGDGILPPDYILDAEPTDEELGIVVEWPHQHSFRRQARLRKPTFHILTRDDFEALPEPDWLIEGWLAQDSFAVLFGAPEAGKSFLALDFAASIATGKKFLGLFPLGKNAKGDVFYIVGESGNRFPKRIRAWEVAKNGGKKIPFFGLNGPVDMSDLTAVEALAGAIQRAIGDRLLRLITVDTLARCFGTGDENNTKDMNAFVAGCDMLRAAFPGSTLLVLHHTGWGDAKRERGSRALRGALDTALSLEMWSDHKTLVLRVEKQKDAARDDKPLYMELADVPHTNSAALTSLDPAEARKRKKAGAQSAADKLLAAIIAAGAQGIARTGLQSVVKSKTTRSDALKRLQQRGKVRESDGRFFACEPDS